MGAHTPLSERDDAGHGTIEEMPFTLSFDIAARKTEAFDSEDGCVEAVCPHGGKGTPQIDKTLRRAR